MDKLTEIRIYGDTYRQLASQLSTRAIAGDWYRMGVTAQDAAAWASLGYQPGEAAELITLGITPDMAAGLEAIDRGDDSPEQYAMRVLDRLAERGLQIRPAGDQS